MGDYLFFSSLDQVVQNMWDFISPQTEKKGNLLIYFLLLFSQKVLQNLSFELFS